MTPRRPHRAAVPTAAAGLGLLTALALGLTLVTSARAATFCDRGGEVPATEQDRQLQVVAVARRVLVASGVEAALVSRSGTDLSRFQLQYSHSGLALKDSRNGPWSVRQLYYACDESRARLYDQGLAGFLLIYHEIIQLARQVMIELDLSDPEIRLEERPPGRGGGHQ